MVAAVRGEGSASSGPGGPPLSPRRIAILGAAVVALVCGAAAPFAWSAWVEPALASRLAAAGALIVRTPVTLPELAFDPLRGRGDLRGLRVSSPTGFAADFVLEVGAVDVAVDPGSLLSRTLVVESIVVDRPVLIHEVATDMSSLRVVHRNADERAHEADAGAGGRRLTLRHFAIRGGEVVIQETAVHRRRISVGLSDFELHDVGVDESFDRVAERVLASLVKAVDASVGRADMEAVGSEIRRDAEGFKSELDRDLRQLSPERWRHRHAEGEAQMQVGEQGGAAIR